MHLGHIFLLGLAKTVFLHCPPPLPKPREPPQYAHMGNWTKHVLHVLYRLVKASTRFEEKKQALCITSWIPPSVTKIVCNEKWAHSRYSVCTGFHGFSWFQFVSIYIYPRSRSWYFYQAKCASPMLCYLLSPNLFGQQVDWRRERRGLWWGKVFP